MTKIPMTNGGTDPAEEVAAALVEIADDLEEHAEELFECTCDPIYEPDTNATIHRDHCRIWLDQHYDIILRSAANYLAALKPPPALASVPAPITIREYVWRLEPIEPALLVETRAALLAKAAEHIEPGFGYVLNVTETGGRSNGGGFECVITASAIPVLDLPFELTIP